MPGDAKQPPPSSQRPSTLHPDLLFPDVPDAEEDLLLFAPTASTSHEGLSRWSIDQIGTDAATREQYNRLQRSGGNDKGKGKLVDFETGSDDGRRSMSTSPVKEGRIRDGVSQPRSGIFDEDQPLVSPLGAKAIASVTGAVMTSLLSKCHTIFVQQNSEPRNSC